MSVEPHTARTVRTPVILPPKPERIAPQPKLSIFEEARLVRKRFASTWGFRSTESGKASNEKSMINAAKAREELADKIAVALSEHGEMRSREIRALLDISRNSARAVLRMMRDEGRVEMRKDRCNHAFWVLA